MPPIVSVILPTYNRPQFLREATISMLRQTFKSLEIIIVDDGSKTPETAQIVSEIANQDSRVRYARKRNEGPASARNFGSKESRGEFLCFMDDDDISHPRRVEIQEKFLRSHPDIAAVATALRHFHSSTKMDSIIGAPTSITLAKNPPLESAPTRISDLFMGATMMIRRSVFMDMRGYDENFLTMEDWDFNLRLEEAHTTGKIMEPLYWYRIHDHGNVSRSPHTWLHACAAYAAAMLRRRGSPRFDCPISDLARYASHLPLSLKSFLARDVCKRAKRLLRAKNYAALNELLKDFNLAFGGHMAAPVYFRILLWSLWFGKLPAFAIVARNALIARKPAL